ncbi:MAG: D-alanine--D-alanine ligase [Pseudomonadota bacterium]
MGRQNHVAVLMGGWSAEREVSLDTGAAVMASLERLGYQADAIDMTRNVAADLKKTAPDVVFNALHGRFGEDGCVQGLLEVLGIAYTHSGVAASALAMDKLSAKEVFAATGLPVAEDEIVTREALFANDPMPRPYVLKPVREGSSVGVMLVGVEGGYMGAIGPETSGPWDDHDALMCERYIPGRELSVAVLDDEPLGVIELCPRDGFYDYTRKYTSGMTDHIMPAELDDEVTARAMEVARVAHECLGCRGVSRSDFRFEPAKGVEGLILLETNTQPGMTELSLVPEIAAYTGISFDALIQRLIDDAGLEK